MNTSSTYNRERIALNIRKAMLEADLTQAELAEALGVSRSTLGVRLSAKKPFTTDELENIAEITKTTFAQLVQLQDRSVSAA